MPDILEMLTAERDKLNRAIEALSVGIGTALGRMARLKRRTVSASARARMAAGQRARRAEMKGQSGKTNAAKKKFAMSAEARARISKAMKARWAEKKKGR